MNDVSRLKNNLRLLATAFQALSEINEVSAVGTFHGLMHLRTENLRSNSGGAEI